MEVDREDCYQAALEVVKRAGKVTRELRGIQNMHGACVYLCRRLMKRFSERRKMFKPRLLALTWLQRLIRK